MHRLQLATIIFFALVILLSAHTLVYFSVISFFSITLSLEKSILFAALSFFGLSFFVSTLLAHWRENPFTKAYYFASCFWIGLLTNILFAVAAASLMLAALGIFYPGLRLAPFGTAALLAALAYSIYGIWNALDLEIKEIRVPLPNLPNFWKGKKIIQLSDVHLGHIRGEKFFRKIIQKINLQKPDLLVITGDLFDGMDGNLETLARSLDNLHAKEGIFFITGNHETYLGTELVFRALEQTKIRLLHDEVADLFGLKLIGVDYPDLNEVKNLPSVLSALKKEYFGCPNILLCHSPVSIAKVKDAGVNLMLSGHTHKGQLFPLGYITKLIFKGYDYGFHRLENFYVYTTSGAGTWGPPMRTGTKPEIVSITLE